MTLAEFEQMAYLYFFYIFVEVMSETFKEIKRKIKNHVFASDAWRNLSIGELSDLKKWVDVAFLQKTIKVDVDKFVEAVEEEQKLMKKWVNVVLLGQNRQTRKEEWPKVYKLLEMAWFLKDVERVVAKSNDALKRLCPRTVVPWHKWEVFRAWAKMSRLPDPYSPEMDSIEFEVNKNFLIAQSAVTELAISVGIFLTIVRTRYSDRANLPADGYKVSAYFNDIRKWYEKMQSSKRMTAKIGIERHAIPYVPEVYKVPESNDTQVMVEMNQEGEMDRDGKLVIKEGEKDSLASTWFVQGVAEGIAMQRLMSFIGIAAVQCSRSERIHKYLPLMRKAHTAAPWAKQVFKQQLDNASDGLEEFLGSSAVAIVRIESHIDEEKQVVVQKMIVGDDDGKAVVVYPKEQYYMALFLHTGCYVPYKDLGAHYKFYSHPINPLQRSVTFKMSWNTVSDVYHMSVLRDLDYLDSCCGFDERSTVRDFCESSVIAAKTQIIGNVYINMYDFPVYNLERFIGCLFPIKVLEDRPITIEDVFVTSNKRDNWVLLKPRKRGRDDEAWEFVEHLGRLGSEERNEGDDEVGLDVPDDQNEEDVGEDVEEDVEEEVAEEDEDVVLFLEKALNEIV